MFVFGQTWLKSPGSMYIYACNHVFYSQLKVLSLAQKWRLPQGKFLRFSADKSAP